MLTKLQKPAYPTPKVLRTNTGCWL